MTRTLEMKVHRRIQLLDAPNLEAAIANWICKAPDLQVAGCVP